VGAKGGQLTGLMSFDATGAAILGAFSRGLKVLARGAARFRRRVEEFDRAISERRFRYTYRSFPFRA
jgi:hypothetical protein